MKIREVDGSIVFTCPGCRGQHSLPVSVGPTRWEWNGDVDKPTIAPSFKRTTGSPHAPQICHGTITDGRVFYHSDTTHALVGQTVDVPEL